MQSVFAMIEAIKDICLEKVSTYITNVYWHPKIEIRLVINIWEK